VDIWHFIMSEAIHFGDTRFAEAYENMEPEKEIDPELMVEILEEMVAVSAGATVDVDKAQDALYKVTGIFFKALANMNMDVPELYKRYLVKNQLNTFRQDHGYKEGTYVKIWDAVEDNVVAFNIMDEHPDLTPEQLYKKLEAEYKP